MKFQNKEKKKDANQSSANELAIGSSQFLSSHASLDPPVNQLKADGEEKKENGQGDTSFQAGFSFDQGTLPPPNNFSSINATAFQLKSENGLNKLSAQPIQRAASPVIQMVTNQERARLKKRMGKNKYSMASKAGKLDYFIKMSNAELEAIKGGNNKEFEDSLPTLGHDYLNRDEAFEDPEPQSLFGRIGAMFGLGSASDEGDKQPAKSTYASGGYGVGYDNSSGESMSREDAESLVEDEEESGSLKDQLIKAVEIKIWEKSSETEVDNGDKGKSTTKSTSSETLTSEGLSREDEYESTFEQDHGRAGKYERSAKGSFKRSLNEMSGEAEIEMSIGHKHEKAAGFGKWGSDNNNIRMGGKLESFAGVKMEGSTSAEVNAADGSFKTKGKAGASAGISSEGQVQLMFQANGKEVLKTTGKVGIMIGAGGEISYILSFSDGVLKIGSSGKGAIGIGFTWGYEVELNAPGIMSSLGDAIWSGASWGASKIGSAAHMLNPFASSQ